MRHDTSRPETAESDAAARAAVCGSARVRLERQLQVLGELAEIGLELARAVEAESQGPGADLAAAVLSYSRVSRAVRQTIMLQSRLIETLEGRQTTQAGRKAAAARILRGVIEDEGGDGERPERLRTEAAERLEDLGDLDQRPFGEAVAEICRGLGLSPDWLRLAEDCFEAEAALDGKAAAAPAESGPIEIRWLDSEPEDPGDSS